MRIVFTRAERGESIATIYRPDGVVVELPSYSRKHRVPHDLAHVVAEREFGLADGVFGTVAAGGLFDNVKVVSGRTKHDAAARSKRILDANKHALTRAEIMAGVLHAAVEGTATRSPGPAARHDWGIVSQDPFPWTDAQVNAAVEVLREVMRAWERDNTVDFFWPDRLVKPVPAAAGGSPRR
jgi:hypothetical protein